MSLSHSTGHRSPRLTGRLIRPVSDQKPTRHPAICLVGGLGFIAAMAVVFHLVFNVLMG